MTRIDVANLRRRVREAKQEHSFRHSQTLRLLDAVVEKVEQAVAECPRLQHEGARCPGCCRSAGCPDGHGPTADELARLTPRQQQVAELVAQGWHDKEIAKLLPVEPGREPIAAATVNAHVGDIMEALDLSSRVALAVWYHTGKRVRGGERLSGTTSR